MTSQNIKSQFCLVGYRYLKKQFDVININSEKIHHGVTLEYLHKTRVAFRRLRDALVIFEKCIRKKHNNKLFIEAKKINHVLSIARDLDIQIHFLEQFRLQLKNEKHLPGIKRLILRRKQLREKWQRKVEKSLEKYFDLNLSQKFDLIFKDNFQNLRLYKKNAQAIFNEISFRELFQTQIDKVLTFDELIRNPLNVGSLHLLRIEIRRLRYTGEIFQQIFPNDLKEKVIILRNLQDILGNIHDCDVWIEYLPQFLEKEREKIFKFFGNTNELFSIKPGILFFKSYEVNQRNKFYNEFIKIWDKLKEENFFKEFMNFKSISTINIHPI